MCGVGFAIVQIFSAIAFAQDTSSPIFQIYRKITGLIML